MRVLEKLFGRSVGRTAERQREVHEAQDDYERELMEHDVDAAKADTFVAAGDGELVPGLPTATPRELYGEFEHDGERPRDQAP